MLRCLLWIFKRKLTKKNVSWKKSTSKSKTENKKREPEVKKKLEDYELYELIFKAPDYEKVYFENKYLVTGHLPTRAIYGAKPDEIYISNNHIAIDCASGYGGRVGCIRLDDFKTFYSQTDKEEY